MSGHTPGPWALEDNDIVQHDTDGATQLIACAYATIADAYDDLLGAEQMANARLMAAAPRLLAALRLMLHTHDVHGPCRHYDCDECRRAVTDAGAAIAKATGKTP
jgi:hypothetical protein